MAEFWKSTPKYWCKHCSTYVKDTKFERTQHEATGKHQGNLKRFLRGVHQEHEKEEREKQRAKAEVDRLRGLVGGGSSSSALKASSSTTPKPRAPTSTPQVSIAERKKQMAQLVEMGISVPEEFRGDLALAGEWQTLSQRSVNPEQGTPSEPLSVGVRKRKIEDEEDEEETTSMQSTTRRGWGSTTRTYPGNISKAHSALDDLLHRDALPKKELPSQIKAEGDDEKDKIETQSAAGVKSENMTEDDQSAIKKEIDVLTATSTAETPLREEESPPNQSVQPEIIFKKRKPKVAKHG